MLFLDIAMDAVILWLCGLLVCLAINIILMAKRDPDSLFGKSMFIVKISFDIWDYWPVVEVTERKVKYALIPPVIITVESL